MRGLSTVATQPMTPFSSQSLIVPPYPGKSGCYMYHLPVSVQIRHPETWHYDRYLLRIEDRLGEGSPQPLRCKSIGENAEDERNLDKILPIAGPALLAFTSNTSSLEFSISLFLPLAIEIARREESDDDKRLDRSRHPSDILDRAPRPRKNSSACGFRYDQGRNIAYSYKSRARRHIVYASMKL